MPLSPVFLAQKVDWSPALVLAALAEVGLTQKELASRHGLSQSALSHALRKPSPRIEGLIAAALDLHPKRIWPSRYDRRGKALFGHWGERSRRRQAAQREAA